LRFPDTKDLAFDMFVILFAIWVCIIGMGRIGAARNMIYHSR